MIVSVLMPVLIMITDCDEKRCNDCNNIEQNFDFGQLLTKDQIGKSDCEYGSKLLDDSNHRKTEESHGVVSNELREDTLENAERKRREILCIDIIDELVLGVAAHIEQHDQYGAEAAEEEQLERAHAGVPRAEELACDQVVG